MAIYKKNIFRYSYLRVACVGTCVVNVWMIYAYLIMYIPTIVLYIVHIRTFKRPIGLFDRGYFELVYMYNTVY